jgi:hypothetical protein
MILPVLSSGLVRNPLGLGEYDFVLGDADDLVLTLLESSSMMLVVGQEDLSVLQPLLDPSNINPTEISVADLPVTEIPPQVLVQRTTEEVSIDQTESFQEFRVLHEYKPPSAWGSDSSFFDCHVSVYFFVTLPAVVVTLLSVVYQKCDLGMPTQ